MSEDVKPDVIKRTQELLGKHIKRPPLTEKLLKKPPFRFLHDIITSVINGTGFLDGILTSAEMNHQNIKDKESKIVFLQKVIDAVREATSIPLTVRPNKIVAGHEPTKTNEFLQAIGKGIEAQKNASSGAPAQPGKRATKTTPSSQLTKQGASKDKLQATTPKDTKSRNLSQDRLKAKGGEKNKKLASTSTKSHTNSKESISETNKKSEIASLSLNRNETFGPVVLDTKSEVKSTVVDNLEGEPEMLEPVDESIDSLHAPVTEDVPQELEMARPPSAHFRQRNSTASKNPDVTNAIESATMQPLPLNQKDDIPPAHPTIDDRLENTKLRRPMSTRPPSARPASSRPAAPRIRDHGEVPRTEEIRPISRQVNVITENDTVNDKEANDFLIKPKPAATEEQLLVESTSQPAEEGKHGHLVDQILETQKDLGDSNMHSTQNKMHTKKTDIEWEGGRKRDRETLKQEVTKLRDLVQKTARIVNPAGKRMEFVQEDVDTMNHDLETWLETTKQLSSQLQEEQRLTDQAVEPMRLQLVQLEDSIGEKRAQISALKAIVLQNDKRIRRLLLGELD